MRTSGLPHKSHMTLDLFREGDRVTPTYGLLRGTPGAIAAIRNSKFGCEMVVIRFGKPVKKYSNQAAKVEWGYEPENVRLESYASVTV